MESATLSRRTLFKGAAVVAAAAAGAPLLSGCDVVVDTDDPDARLLRRATFGLTGAELDRLRAMGADAWLDEQLDPARLDTSAVDAKVARMPLVGAPIGELIAQRGDEELPVAASMQLRLATAIRQLESPAQLYERMVELWSDHFNVPMLDNPLRILKVVEDREVIRRHALGTFRDLLLASATSPAMLHYLDGARSFAGAINENYARELLELHTVGVGGGYDEGDVVELARLLTGWTITRGKGTFDFRADRHDTGHVEIMGWERPSGGDPFEHGQQFLAWLAVHPSTASFVATKLARRFVADDPDPALVERLANVYLANDTSIVPVLRALFTDPAFAEAPPKFRRPNDWLVAAGRAIGATIEPTTDVQQSRRLGRATSRLGQPAFGWGAPNGYPDVESGWLTSGGLLARWNLAGDLVAGVLPLVDVDLAPLRAGLDGLTIDEVLDAIVVRVLRQPPTAHGRHVLLSHSGFWSGDVPSSSELDEVVRRTITLLLSTADFQHR